jgi:aspartyl-tRNA(Asn)/glutamyl-tRNA(Gln) amidotransferase subunit A
MGLHSKTIAELAQGLRDKEYSATELAQHYLARIESTNDDLNAVVTLTEEQALAAARQADTALAADNAGPLTGIPLLHKDIFCTDGVRTACGSKMLDRFIAPYDATVVSKLSRAGMVMLGKTNMDEFAMGSSNETSYYGVVKNPWDTARVPGGSSGGSAAAMAARLAAVTTGTDTGGSIRQPAALCGVTGLKPTYGRISRYGMIAFASSLDQAGPMTVDAQDAALMLNAMSGFDKRDSTSVDHPVPDYTANLNDSIEGLRVGIPKEFFNEGLDDAIASLVKEAITELEKQGAVIKEISLPNMQASVPTYYVVAPAECSSNLSRMDGVRFGYRCENPKDLGDLYARSRGEGFGAEVKRRIMIGTYALSTGFYDAYYLKAQKVRRVIAEDFKQAFKDIDVIAGPVSPETAFKLGEKANDPVTMYLSDIYTIAVNLAGLPGMSIPCGFSNGLPVGLQLIGNIFDEARLLNTAHQYQQATDWHRQIPEQFQ